MAQPAPARTGQSAGRGAVARLALLADVGHGVAAAANDRGEEEEEDEDVDHGADGGENPEQVRQLRGQSTLGGSTATDYPLVYVDGRQYGDIGSLRSLIPSQVSLIHYYDPSMAAGKFGMTAGSGVIDVTTRQ